jgi:hypothetical protein
MVVHVTSLGPTDQRPGEPFVVVKPPRSEILREVRDLPATHLFISVDVTKRGGQLCKFTVHLHPVFNLGANSVDSDSCTALKYLS